MRFLVIPLPWCHRILNKVLSFDASNAFLYLDYSLCGTWGLFGVYFKALMTLLRSW